MPNGPRSTVCMPVGLLKVSQFWVHSPSRQHPTAPIGQRTAAQPGNNSPGSTRVHRVLRFPVREHFCSPGEHGEAHVFLLTAAGHGGLLPRTWAVAIPWEPVAGSSSQLRRTASRFQLIPAGLGVLPPAPRHHASSRPANCFWSGSDSPLRWRGEAVRRPIS